ncbi:MAG: RseA family anti-sigma factor [Pseudomonadota bacterium]
MSREALQESLSAVMDNEADELELRRLLAASDDPQLRSTWSRYQVARAAMHKDLLLPDLDIAAAVSAALADEPVQAPVKVVTRSPWQGLGRMAVAASVTVAVLAGVRLYNQDELAGQQLAQQAAPSVLTLPPAQGAALLTGYSTDAQQPLQSPLQNSGHAASVTWHEQSFPFYIRQQAPQMKAESGMPSAQPHAQAASLENR